ncbi:hypothetical protein BD289DRAFT_180086 [Coniella lustricola]|uniref:Uncharacterized protein n=1 Tax=Coniella lustricola TaxID=2025994 RepID=A0A2T2ZTF6_9PEZI|nr:hypothetical protein BD289DRAFT_180086 [Coniella lustricola]
MPVVTSCCRCLDVDAKIHPDRHHNPDPSPNTTQSKASRCREQPPALQSLLSLSRHSRRLPTRPDPKLQAETRRARIHTPQSNNRHWRIRKEKKPSILACWSDWTAQSLLKLPVFDDNARSHDDHNQKPTRPPYIPSRPTYQGTGDTEATQNLAGSKNTAALSTLSSLLHTHQVTHNFLRLTRLPPYPRSNAETSSLEFFFLSQLQL